MSSEQSDFFDRNVSTRLQRALTKSILENCKQASRFCWRNFAAPQAKDLSGNYRRAKIEDEFPGVAGLFKNEGVTCSIQQYENNTGFYNELTSGCVRLTESCITDSDLVPRMAKFRATLARDGQQSFAWAEDAEPSGSEFLYAILTYGIDINSPKRSWPAFINIQFPNEDFTRYINDGIDLFRRFPDLVAEYIPKPSFGGQIKRRRRRRASGE
jgi:hypothetical protein